MSGYYSFKNGTSPSANFSVGNTQRASFVNASSNYNIQLNNAGYVNQNSSVSNNSNSALLFGLDTNNYSGLKNTLQQEQNVNDQFNRLASNTLQDGDVTIKLYPNENKPYQN